MCSYLQPISIGHPLLPPTSIHHPLTLDNSSNPLFPVLCPIRPSHCPPTCLWSAPPRPVAALPGLGTACWYNPFMRPDDDKAPLLPDPTLPPITNQTPELQILQTNTYIQVLNVFFPFLRSGSQFFHLVQDGFSTRWILLRLGSQPMSLKFMT